MGRQTTAGFVSPLTAPLCHIRARTHTQSPAHVPQGQERDKRQKTPLQVVSIAREEEATLLQQSTFVAELLDTPKICFTLVSCGSIEHISFSSVPSSSILCMRCCMLLLSRPPSSMPELRPQATRPTFYSPLSRSYPQLGENAAAKQLFIHAVMAAINGSAPPPSSPSVDRVSHPRITHARSKSNCKGKANHRAHEVAVLMVFQHCL